MQIRSSLIGIALVISSLSPGGRGLSAQDSAQADSSRRALIRLIDEQIAAPLANIPRWAQLSDSARARHDVDVTYSPGLVAWMCRGSKATGPQRWKTVLVTAYIAGDMREQLISGVKRNEPMAGVRTVFDVYAKLKAIDPSFDVPEIDEWHNLEATGTLETHVAAALKQSCPS